MYQALLRVQDSVKVRKDALGPQGVPRLTGEA